MKKFLMMVAVALMTALSAEAQTSLVGREYHNPNIMSDIYKDIERQVADMKAKALVKIEEKKGRKLTEAEMKEFKELIGKEESKLRAMKNGTSMSMTVTFKNDKTAVVKAKMKMTDEAMKAADIGWLKRKALKAAMAVMPAIDMPYIIKGNMVILQDEEENDTLYISADRNSLSGIYRGKKKSENIHYTLARTK
ncbi:MAG: hypothetical protein IKQ86_00645 [Prevotella sp.]|jgi:hypothetical protein|nr:hypothetical protein [Prevotella sp.]